MKFINIFSLKSWKRSIAEIRKNKRKTAYLFFYFIAIVIVTTIIHESAHFLAALAIGVPFNEIEVGFIGINPSITIPERFTSTDLTVYHYAGGLTAAMFLLCLYLLYWLRRYRRKPSLLNWFMGLVTILAVSMQLTQGYLEGRFHSAYVYYASSLFDPLDILYFILTVSAILIHFTLCPMPKIKRKEQVERRIEN